MLIFAFYTVFFVSVFNSKKCHLFSDAEICKYIAQYFIVCHFTDDFGEVVDGGAEVFAHKVAAEAQVEAVLYSRNGFERVVEGFVMTEIGDYGVVASVGI